MIKYWNVITDSFIGYWNYLTNEIVSPGINNYFYWLLGLSACIWLLEIVMPWRKDQSVVRKDFWLDGFYMFFNFFIFSLIGFNALSNLGVTLFNDLIGLFGITNLVAIKIGTWPVWSQFLILLLVSDFIGWNVHRLLHKLPVLWEFHKLHHSVKEMGFAAHLRFHWMETIIYRLIQYIPIAMIGFSIQDFFLVHIFSVLIGHLNHANLGWTYGPLKYILNNPVMHLWHHAKHLPADRPFGVNFGLTLSIWDYLFGTVYIEKKNNPELGFTDEKNFPQTFLRQIFYPFYRKKS